MQPSSRIDAASALDTERILVKQVLYLIGTGDDAGELIPLLLLALDHGLKDGRMVRSKIDKDMGHSGLVWLASVMPLVPLKALIGKFHIPPRVPRKRQKMQYKPWEDEGQYRPVSQRVGMVLTL